MKANTVSIKLNLVFWSTIGNEKKEYIIHVVEARKIGNRSLVSNIFFLPYC